MEQSHSAELFTYNIELHPPELPIPPLDGAKSPRQQYLYLVIRTPVIFLISTFLSLGPACFERLHIAEINRELARIPVPKIATNLPLKRLPVRQPVHDPATCAICSLIHAPAVSQVWLMPSISPTARAGWITSESFAVAVPVRISCLQCRGPPIA